jgi:hypothetical protein
MGVFDIWWRSFVLCGVFVAVACSEGREFNEGGGESGSGGSLQAGSGGRAGGTSGRGGNSNGNTGGAQAGAATAGGRTSGGGASATAAAAGETQEGGAGEPGPEPGTGGAGAGGAAGENPCEPNPCTHGSCEADGASYACTCDAGYRGDNCEIDIDDCEDEPCTNGTCVDAVDAFQCECGDTGYTGELCDTLVQNCEQTPCSNGGQCTNVGASRTCDCTGTGYMGTDCNVDIDECDDDPCDPLTTCTNSAGGFSCTNCPSGYTGNGESGCRDVDECRTNNGGCDALTTCTNTTGGRNCGTCPTGYTGKGETGCTNIDDCEGNPCKNGGSCEDGINAFQCTCSGAWSGSTCQNATLTINATARGFYTDVDWFPPSHGNTLTGALGPDLSYAAFLVFPIPNFTGSVSSVTLRLEHELYSSPDPSELVSIRDVSTSVSTLINTTAASAATVAIYQDLATGTSYGSLSGWTAATVGMVRSITLSAGVTPISNARGSNFALSIIIDSLSRNNGEEVLRFASDTEPRTHQLQVVVVPP